MCVCEHVISDHVGNTQAREAVPYPEKLLVRIHTHPFGVDGQVEGCMHGNHHTAHHTGSAWRCVKPPAETWHEIRMRHQTLPPVHAFFSHS